MVLILLAGILLLFEPVSSCPSDIIKKAQDCFADLATGVTLDEQMSIAGNLPLDYQKIKEYCEKDGHMSRFLVCVDKLLEQCRNKTESDILHQLINPDKVRSSVPRLCENIEEIEINAECMNKQMNKPSECKAAAYDLIRRGMSETTGNVTAMFHIQCRFFSVLAECQRTAVADNCGQKLGDLHANFLLSFVPNTCANEGIANILLQKSTDESHDSKIHTELQNIKLKNNIPKDDKKPLSDEPGEAGEGTPGRSSRSKKTVPKGKNTTSSAIRITQTLAVNVLSSLALLLAVK